MSGQSDISIEELEYRREKVNIMLKEYERLLLKAEKEVESKGHKAAKGAAFRTRSYKKEIKMLKNRRDSMSIAIRLQER